MSAKKIGTIAYGLTSLIVIGYVIYNALQGNKVGFEEILVISVVFMMFLSGLTWGTDKTDGILQEEELGQKIIEKSAKISYYILMGIIIVVLGVEEYMIGTLSTSLLIVLAAAMLTMPLVEFFVARKYQ